MNEELLIETVRNYEFLYNAADKGYHDLTKKENAWKEISRAVKFSVPECKKKWSSLRDSYRRAMRKKRTRSGQRAKYCKPWIYEAQMQFLQPFIAERKTSSNLSPSSDNTGAHEDATETGQTVDHQSDNDETDSDFETLSNYSSRTVDGANSRGSSPVSLAESTVSQPESLIDSSGKASPSTTDSSGKASTSTPRSSSSLGGKRKAPPLSTVLKDYFDAKLSAEKVKHIDKTKEKEKEKEQIEAPAISSRQMAMKTFFDSMFHTVCTFPVPLQIEFKGKLSALVNEFEVKTYNAEIESTPNSAHVTPVKTSVPKVHYIQESPGRPVNLTVTSEYSSHGGVNEQIDDNLPTFSSAFNSVGATSTQQGSQSILTESGKILLSLDEYM